MNDQGWGNRAGRLYLVRIDNGKAVDWKDIFGVVKRTWSKKTAYIKSSDKIFKNAKKGTTFRLLGRSGGGGGHKLYLRWLKIKFTGTKKVVAKATPIKKNFSFGRKY